MYFQTFFCILVKHVIHLSGTFVVNKLNFTETATHRRQRKHKMSGVLSDDAVHIDHSQTEKSPHKKRHKLHRSKDDGSILAYCRRLK